MAGNNYQVDYEDERFQQVEDDKQTAMDEMEQTYDDMIDQSDSYYQEQIDASKEWEETQKNLQQEQTDFTIEQIEQQKEQEHKDYLKEQSGAYVDWQKQSNQYGANAEAQAAGGMNNTGFSESSQVSMYNTYQNRVAQARESYKQIVMDFNNQITQARLQNNSALAEIAMEAQRQRLELALQGFQYKNQLILEQANKKVEMDNMYWQRYQDVLSQINQENAMAEEVRQFNASLAEEQRQYNQSYELSVKQFNEEVRQYNQDYEEKVRQFNEEIERLKAKDAQENKLAIQELELKKAQLAEEKRQFDAQMKQKEAQLIKASSSGSSSGRVPTAREALLSAKQGSNSSGYTVVNSPLTTEGAAERVARGELNARVEGNKIYVSPNPDYVKGQDLLNKYTSLLKR